VERDEVIVHDLPGERVRRLEGEHQTADQPEGQEEAAEEAHGATFARIAVRAALESDAASDLQIGEAV
jgi:hypothetical protein